MAATLTHRYGDMDDYVSDAELDELILELDEPLDPEHPDIAVVHESGWGISAFPSGLIVWENVESDEASPRFLRDVSRDELRRLLRHVVRGELNVVEQHAWLPGYAS